MNRSIVPCDFATGRGHESPEDFRRDAGAQSAPIGVTEQHPFWSLDRNDWVPAGKLHRGERVLVAGGTAEVGNWERAGEEPVYIIEVEGDHCYRVGQQGVLVHNASVAVAPESVSGDAVWCITDEFRASRGLPVLGGAVPVPKDKTGSVAVIFKTGWRHFGLNSKDRNAQENQLARAYYQRMNDANAFEGFNVVNYGFGASTFLTHSEALSLIEYNENAKGAVASTLIVYNDRETCGKCLTYLPLLLKFLGIQQVTFINKGGSQFAVNATDLPSPKNPPPTPESGV